jgi:hypothetical protein
VGPKDWDNGAEIAGADGRTRVQMCLLSYRFEVSWQTGKAAIVRRKGIELREAVRLLNDPNVRLESQDEHPYVGQYRATGVAPDGRLMTIAINLDYPDDDENFEDVGIIRVHTAWEASSAERALYNNDR